LEHAQENAYQADQKDLIAFDQLSQDRNSETHRVFDLYHKKFFALKTLSLDSESSWKQLNLMLRQHFNEGSRLAPIHSFSYNPAKKQVKILSEIQKTIVGEYASHRKRQGLAWSTQELKTVIWHLLKIINAFKFQGASTDSLKPAHIFFDSKEGKLRAFDYPGAKPLRFWDWFSWRNMNGFDVALQTLVQIIDPYVRVDNPEDAKAYLNANYPKFKKELYHLERTSWGRGFFHDNLLPLDQIFETQANDEFLLRALKKTLDEKYSQYSQESGVFDHLLNAWKKNMDGGYPRNTPENWAFVNQGLGKFDEASLILKNLLTENTNKYGAYHPTVAKGYLDLAELYHEQGNYQLSSQYFQSAFNTSYATHMVGKDFLARLSFRYGQLLLKLNHYNKKPAMKEFQKAHDLLKDNPNGSARLKKDIQKALGLGNSSSQGYWNSEHWEKRRWKKRKIFKIILILICLKIIYSKCKSYHSKHCQQSIHREQYSQFGPWWRSSQDNSSTQYQPQNHQIEPWWRRSQNDSSMKSQPQAQRPVALVPPKIESRGDQPLDRPIVDVEAQVRSREKLHSSSQFDLSAKLQTQPQLQRVAVSVPPKMERRGDQQPIARPVKEPNFPPNVETPGRNREQASQNKPYQSSQNNSSIKPQPQLQRPTISVPPKIESRVDKQPISQPVAELNLPKPVPVAVAVEPQQESNFAWFLLGLNVVIGFAGLTMSNIN